MLTKENSTQKERQKLAHAERGVTVRGWCRICERKADTRHHIVPRQIKAPMPGQQNRIPLCFACHSWLHKYYSNAELAEEMGSIEEMAAHPDIQARRKQIQALPQFVSAKPVDEPTKPRVRLELKKPLTFTLSEMWPTDEAA